jgi:CTP synthase
LKKDTLAYQAYANEHIKERHRHRYEFNNKFKKVFEKYGMIFSGINPETKLCEVIELKNHPWFVAVQYHPEFLSRPERPHPLFRDFIQASIRNSEN